MDSVDRHPPVDRRCQIYVGFPLPVRCQNEGTHWEKWGGCSCNGRVKEVCESDFYSWECGGEHDVQGVLSV